MGEFCYGLSTSLGGKDCYLDRLPQLKEDGIACLELCLREDLEQESALLPAALEAVQSAGLSIWSIHLPFGPSVNPAEPDEEKRLENLQNIRRFIRLIEPCGAKIYVIHGSAEPVPEQLRGRMLEAAVQTLSVLHEELRASGRALALENLPRTCIGSTAAEMEQIGRQIPELSFCFDLNHFTPRYPNYSLRPLQRRLPFLRRRLNPVGDDPAAFVRKNAGRIVTLHISDYDGVDECHWIPGQGILNFREIALALKEGGYSGALLFEPNEVCRGLQTTGARLIQGYERAVKTADAHTGC